MEKNDSIILKKKTTKQFEEKKKKVIKLNVKFEYYNEDNKQKIKEFRIMICFKNLNFLAFLKESNINGLELASEIILLTEITRLAFNEETKQFKISMNNKYVLLSIKNGQKEFELLNHTMDFIKKQMKLIKSIYLNSLNLCTITAKFQTCCHFEKIAQIDNQQKTINGNYLNCNSLNYFYHSLNSESGKMLNNHLYYGQVRFWVKELKNETHQQLMLYFKQKQLKYTKSYAIFVLSKPLVNLETMAINKYLDVYKDVLDRASLPEWMDMNLIYLFKFEKKIIEKLDKEIPYLKILKLT